MLTEGSGNKDSKLSLLGELTSGGSVISSLTTGEIMTAGAVSTFSVGVDMSVVV